MVLGVSEAILSRRVSGEARQRALELFDEHLDLADRGVLSLISDRSRHHWTNVARVRELTSFAQEGLFNAACRFDATHGVPFSAYASIRIRGSILDGVRAGNYLTRRANIRFQRPADAQDILAARITAEADGLIPPTVEGTQQYVAEGDPEHDLHAARFGFVVRELVNTLPKREAELVRRHYLEGERFAHVAAELGLSKSWASRLHTRALERLRKRCVQIGVAA